MSILLAALAVLAQQPAQASLPHPPGTSPEHFGLNLAVDGDRALVAMIEGGEPLIWSYRRIGRDWVPEAPFPALALEGTFGPLPWFQFAVVEASLANTCLELDGDRALVCANATELEFDGAGWVITHDGSGPSLTSVDLENGVALGFVPLGGSSPTHSVLRRGASGWAFDSVAPSVPPLGTAAIDGDVIVAGNPIEPFGPFGEWQGQFWIHERDPVSGDWLEVEHVVSDSGVESLLGANVMVQGDTIFVSDNGWLWTYRRSPHGGWTIGERIGRMRLPSPTSSWSGERESLSPPVVDGNTVFGRHWTFLGGSSFDHELARYEQGSDGDWFVAATYPTAGAARCDVGSPAGVGQVFGRVAAYRLSDSDHSPVGVLAPMQGPDGCLGGVQVFEPVISARTCPGVPTSTGEPAALDLVGSFFRAEERTTLAASGLPAWTFATPLFSTAPGLTVAPAGSVGDLCLDHPITRLLWHSG
ncbi:MAG: hypothetical protein AAFU73_24145, partial [Planctomycetota bacterium]